MHSFGEDVLVPIAAIIFIFGFPVFGFIVFRVLRHRERMALIQSGMPPDMRDKDWRARGSASPADFPPNPYALDAAQVTLRKGISVTFVGFAITLGLSFIGYDDGSWRPGPWLLGGLVPLFVGLAQVVIAVLAGASLRPPAGGAAHAAQVPAAGAQPASPGGAAPNFDTSYTYRPGDTQELRPPRPPERRP